MKHERGIKRVGYFTLAALLVLVAYSYWVSRRIEHGETPPFLSEGAASVVASICALVFYAAVALAGSSSSGLLLRIHSVRFEAEA